jgi:hypothetical protein
MYPSLQKPLPPYVPGCDEFSEIEHSANHLQLCATPRLSGPSVAHCASGQKTERYRVPAGTLCCLHLARHGSYHSFGRASHLQEDQP